MKCNQSRPGFELVLPCSFPTTITITPRAPPYRNVILVLYSHEQLYMHICMQKHIQLNKDKRTQFFRKYASHFIERVRKGYEGYYCVRGELETEQNSNILTPNSYGYNIVSFTFSWAAQPGAWGPSLCWDMALVPAYSLHLIWTSCRRGHITIWPPPTSCERHNSHSIQSLDSQGRPLISSTGCTCYLHRCISSFDSFAGVNMSYLIV